MFEDRSDWLPVILSTGMSSLREIDETVEKIQARNCDYRTAVHFTLPLSPEKIGSNLIPFFRKRYA